ncbi:MAG: SIS domain-containing protein [Rhodocyclales bacterium]|nr:SIS domain-containing protein [Rhodocyclales bacterium]
MRDYCADYATRLTRLLDSFDWSAVETLGLALQRCWRDGRQFFIVGNGGSDGNALHMANDFLYGVGGGRMPGLKVHALGANASVLTCLANDLGYERVFSAQLETLANPGDVLLALSGSGNSPNILRAIEMATHKQMQTFAILGYGGGKAKAMVDTAIHFEVDDMQLAEDCQLIVGHMLMRWLCAHPPEPRA